MLNVRNLSTNDPYQSLTNLSFQIQRGQAVVVLGPNESGKSALLQAVADPEMNFEGEIAANHFKSKIEPEKYKTQVGYLPSDFSLPSHLTGFEYLELIGTFYNLRPKERTDRIIQFGQMLGIQRQLYSLGERLKPVASRKIGLIASILAEPAVIVWDEPFLGFDPMSVAAASQLLNEALKRGASALIATTDLDFAEQAADSYLFLNHGQLVAEGSLTQLAHQTGGDKNLRSVFKNLSDG